MTNTSTSVRRGRPVPFAQVPHALIDDPDIDVYALAVYVALRRAADFTEPHEARIGQERIAEIAGCSVPTMRDRRDLLVEKGWIDYESGKKNWKCNRYLVHAAPPSDGGNLSDEGKPDYLGDGNQVTTTESTAFTERGTTTPPHTNTLPPPPQCDAFPDSQSNRNGAPPIHKLWTIWLDEFSLSHGRDPALTEKRKQKLRKLYEEQLSQTQDPLGSFRRILEAVKKSSYHMGTRAYQFPESLFRSPERRERWFFASREITHEQRKERDRRRIKNLQIYEPGHVREVWSSALGTDVRTRLTPEGDWERVAFFDENTGEWHDVNHARR